MRILALLALAAVLVPVAVGASVRSVQAQAPVSALAVDGRMVAFAAGRSARDCDRVTLWNLRTRAVTTLGRASSCEVTSTGTGIAALSVVGTRALWLHYTGGNIREWSLYTATTTRRAPRLLSFVSRDVDARAPIVVGPADSSRFGDLLPYAVGRVVIALRADGSRRFRWEAPAPVTALGALDGELAVASEDGMVTTLDAAGAVIGEETFDREVQAVRLTGEGLVVQYGRTLALRRGPPGDRTWLLPARASLQDATSRAAYYTVSGQIRELRLDAANRQRQLGLGSQVQVDLTTVVTASGRRVSATALSQR